ncbi:MAG TPA: sigma-70 family RNA polymerase sigma factor [Thermoanaerobaculia bacterium]|nr:sigma-70 family RNA polymerase sigma factor [Thermoanaerobaculia bacterium]
MQDPSTDVRHRAFEEAYLRYAPRLQRIAMRRYSIGATDAEALVQDVFTTYFQHAANVESPERYLIGAICNASKNYLRRRTASRALFCGEEPRAATPDEGPLDEIERKRLLAQMLARVGKGCRDLLYRFYVNGEGTEALAADLRLARGSVKVKLFKCRQRALEAYRAIMRRS